MFAKIKKKIFTKEFIMQSFFVSLLLVFFLFLFANQFSLHYWINGFSKMYKNDLQVYFLDVGQANSTLIIFPNKMSMLVDAGSQKSEDQFIKSVDHILHKNGINEIEYLILTHSDEDHIGGTKRLLEKFDVCNILRPKVLANFENSKYDYNYVTTDIYTETISAVYEEPNCTKNFIEDDVLKFGSVKVEIFSCNQDTYSDTNSYSPFVLIEYENKSFLLTGDATEKREKEFVSDLAYENRKVDIDYLLVSHHGSKYSTTESFLNAITPNFAFVSCEKDYYPSVDVKERLENVGVEKIYNTRDSGTIAVGVKSDSQILLYFKIYFDFPFAFVCASVVCFVFLKYPIVKKMKFRDKKQIFLKKIEKKY